MFFKSSYSLIPLEIRTNDTILRHVWVLRNGEEETAKELVQELLNNELSLENLSDVDQSIKFVSEKRSQKKSCFRSVVQKYTLKNTLPISYANRQPLSRFWERRKSYNRNNRQKIPREVHLRLHERSAFSKGMD